jgi:hypothetical protein
MRILFTPDEPLDSRGNISVLFKLSSFILLSYLIRIKLILTRSLTCFVIFFNKIV